MLIDKKQELKIQAIHDLLRDTLRRAEEYRSIVEAERVESANLVLNSLKSGLGTMLVLWPHISCILG